MPCLSPTLAAVVGLAGVGGDTGRAVVLAIAYCLGIGLPFLAFGLGMRRLAGVVKAIRRNSRWVTRIGGVMLILVGLALVTGAWADFITWLRVTVGAAASPYGRPLLRVPPQHLAPADEHADRVGAAVPARAWPPSPGRCCRSAR